MPVTIERRIQFCAGHRIVGHESKCRNAHGHGYIVFFEAEGDLDQLGRVIDFSVLKARLGQWVETEWDHGFIIWEKDEAMLAALDAFQHMENGEWRQKVYMLPYNPTAENMAKYLLDKSDELLEGTGVRLRSVTVWETENCKATVAR